MTIIEALQDAKEQPGKIGARPVGVLWAYVWAAKAKRWRFVLFPHLRMRLSRKGHAAGRVTLREVESKWETVALP